MAHMIMEHDRGYVQGETWHKMPQYTILDRPVTMDEARTVLNYPLAKMELFLGTGHRVEAWAVVRTDTGTVMVPAVGSEFSVQTNGVILDHIERNVLREFPDLKIESVGTLKNGRVAFLNLKLDEFQVKTDRSPTVSRAIYSNPLGEGCYWVGAHSIRVVCHNTLMMAREEAKTNESFGKIRHTFRAPVKVADALQEIAELRLQAERQRARLDYLAEQAITGEAMLQMIIAKIYPLPDSSAPTTELMLTLVGKRRQALTEQFNREQAVVGHTRYALLNAFTYLQDNRPEDKRWDAGGIFWDGLTGKAAEAKQEALQTLLVA